MLDMGEPVKILDLATDLIRLSGLEVGTDIEIRFTGTRPGEKLYEELFFDSESALPTDHPKVLRAKNGALPIGLSTVVDLLVDGAQRRLERRAAPLAAGPPGPRLPASATTSKYEVDVEVAGCLVSVATTMMVARTPSTCATVPMTAVDVARRLLPGSCVGT